MRAATDRRRGSRPSLAWITIRVTALALAILVLTHFAVTHLLNDVADTDSAFVAERWQSGIVATTDWLMLVMAVLHAGAGLWTVVDDDIRSTRRSVAQAVIAVIGALTVAGGTATLLIVLGRS
jgi:succinate dehydrogenase hydrophobic anchor subunit